MSSRPLWLRVSLLANCIFAVMAVCLAAKRYSASDSRTLPVSGEPPAVITATADPSPTTMTNVVVVTNIFQWDRIESPEFPIYIANLRAIGCPEKTIGDIIIADVDDLYLRKRRIVPLDAPFWQTRAQSWRALRKRLDEQKRLRREMTLLLQQLLGITWYGYPKDDPYEGPMLQFLSGIIDVDQASQVSVLLNRADHEKDEQDSTTLSISLPEDERRTKESNDEFKHNLTAIITSEGLREFELRLVGSNMADKRPACWSALSLNSSEWREVARLIHANIPEKTTILDYLNNQGIIGEATKKESFQAQLQLLLGETRYAQYRVTLEEHFESIYNFVSENNLTTTLSFQIAEIKRQGERQAQEIRQNTSVSMAARTEALKTVRRQVEQTIGALLGEKHADFSKQNEVWLKKMEQP